MKNKKGNVAVIAIVVVIVAITASVITWLVATKTQKPFQKVATTQPVVQSATSAQQVIIKEENNKNTTCEIGSKVYFEVKELGIKFLVDRSIKDDLIYAMGKPEKDGSVSVLFSAKSLLAMNAGCNAQQGNLGAISKIIGKPESGTYYGAIGRFNKQFDGFFVNYSGPQSPCAFNKNGQLDEKTENYASQLRGRIFFTEGDIDCVDKIK